MTTTHLQQPQYALHALAGRHIRDIRLPTPGQPRIAFLTMDNNASMEIGPRTEHFMRGPYLMGNRTLLARPIDRVDVKISADVHNDATMGAFTTIAYVFTTDMGTYQLAWHIEHDDTVAYTLHHSVALPLPHKGTIILRDDARLQSTIDDVMESAVIEFNIDHANGDLVFRLRNGLTVTTNITDKGRAHIDDLIQHIGQPLASFVHNDLIDLYARAIIHITHP